MYKLLTTIGQFLDHPVAAEFMKQYFQRIAFMPTNEVLPSRIRFMLLDLIDLMSKDWKDKNASTGPKTLAAIKKEMDASTAAKASSERSTSSRGGSDSRDSRRRISSRGHANMRDQYRSERSSGGRSAGGLGARKSGAQDRAGSTPMRRELMLGRRSHPADPGPRRCSSIRDRRPSENRRRWSEKGLRAVRSTGPRRPQSRRIKMRPKKHRKRLICLSMCEFVVCLRS